MESRLQCVLEPSGGFCQRADRLGGCKEPRTDCAGQDRGWWSKMGNADARGGTVEDETPSDRWLTDKKG